MTLGRWGIELIQRGNFYVALPTISTISCILVIALSAVFIVDLFELKNKLYIFLTSALFAVTPTLTVTLLYIYTAFAYCTNLLISILVIWFIYKFSHKKIGLVIATLLFALSLSIYQSYAGVTVGLCVMMAIMSLIKNDKKIRNIFLEILKTICVVIIGGLLYYGLTTILLKINNISLSTYKGLNSFSIKDILLGLGTTIPNCYNDFMKFFFKDTIVYNINYRREIFYGIFFIIAGTLTIISCFNIKEDSKKIKIIRSILVIIFVLILPIALNIIDILVVQNEIYALTAMQMILVVPLSFAIFENINKCNIMKWIAVLSCFYVVFTYYIADNASYAALKIRYNQAYGIMSRVIDRIESTPGYNKDFPVCIAGMIGDDNYPQVSSLIGYSVGSVFKNPVFHGSYYGLRDTTHQFIKIFFGKDYKIAHDALYELVLNDEHFKELENFPNENCSAVIADTMVIRISDYIPMPDGSIYNNYVWEGAE